MASSNGRAFDFKSNGCGFESLAAHIMNEQKKLMGHEHPCESEKTMIDFSAQEFAAMIKSALYDMFSLTPNFVVSDSSININDKILLRRFPSGRYKVFFAGASRWIVIMKLNGSHSVKGCTPDDALKYCIDAYIDLGLEHWMSHNYYAGG